MSAQKENRLNVSHIDSGFVQDSNEVELALNGASMRTLPAVEAVMDEFCFQGQTFEEVQNRQHTYLPGVCRPLYPEQWFQAQGNDPKLRSLQMYRNIQSGEPRNISDESTNFPLFQLNLVNLPILELDSVLLFPGSSLPLRLKNSKLVEYIANGINTIRGTGAVPPNISNYSLSDPRSNVVQIGIITRMKRGRKRSLTRSSLAFDSTTEISSLSLHRFSASGLTDSRRREATAARAAGRMGRWRMALLQRRITVPNVPHMDSHRSAPTNRRTTSFNYDQGSQETEQESESFEAMAQYLHQPPSTDPMIGRIGTFATVTYTHEVVDNTSIANVPGQSLPATSQTGRNGVDGEMIITVYGSGRFRVHSPSLDSDRDERVRPEDDSCRFYYVEDLKDEVLTLPPKWLFQNNVNRYDIKAIDISERYIKTHSQLLDHLSLVSSVPKVAWKVGWPWIIAEDVANELLRHPLFHGLAVAVKKHQISVTRSSPTSFSFWLAANLPMVDNDRIDLLETSCTIERLLIIREIIKHQGLFKCICCLHCGTSVGLVKDLFTVGGAEGTSGAYVNAHGILHQTWTLRRIANGSILCLGEAETKDSWFIDYSWKIAYCSICYNHLGWEYTLVSVPNEGHTDEDDLRPNVFFGLSASNVTVTRESPQYALSSSSTHV